MDDNDYPDDLDDRSGAALVRQIAARSGQVAFTRHARQRMVERRVGMRRVLDCLRTGHAVEPVYRNAGGRWIIPMGGSSAGVELKVPVELRMRKDGHWAVVITVIHVN